MRHLGFELDFRQTRFGRFAARQFCRLKARHCRLSFASDFGGKKISFPRGKRFWISAGATGLLQFFLYYGLVFWGIQHVSSGLAAVLQATMPAFGLVLAPFYLPDERVTPRKVFAVALGIAGVVWIFHEQLSISGISALAGSAAIVVGAFFVAYASVLTKAYDSESNSTALLTAQGIIGFVPLAFLGLIWEGNPTNFRWTQTAVVCLWYLALVNTVAAYWLFYWLLRNTEITKVMMTALVIPLVAVFIGSFFGEILHWQALAGGALILSSVGLILFQPKKDLPKTGAVDFSSDSEVAPLKARN